SVQNGASDNKNRQSVGRCQFKDVKHDLSNDTDQPSYNERPKENHELSLPISIDTALAIQGIESFCWTLKGECKAPVATTRKRFKTPFFSNFTECQNVTTDNEAVPREPEWTRGY